MENDEGYSFEVDWWAFGVLLFQMLAVRQLYDISYENLSCNHLKRKVMARIYITAIEKVVTDVHAADLIYRLNEKDPRMRLGNMAAIKE